MAKNRPMVYLWRIDPSLRVQRFSWPAETGRADVTGLASDLVDGLWVAVDKKGFYHLRHGGFDQIVGLAPPAHVLAQILPISPGEAWFPTGRGAAWLKDGRTRILTVANGLPCSNFYGMAIDKQGDLWATAPCGLIEIPSDGTRALAAGARLSHSPARSRRKIRLFWRREITSGEV